MLEVREAEQAAEESSGAVARLAGGSAALLVGRRVALQLIGALSTAFVARLVGVRDFGTLASAQGLLALFQTVVDLGFSFMVSRELASHKRPGQWLGAATAATATTGVIFAMAMAAVGALSGIGTQRGAVLLVLSPTLAASAFLPMRQVFIVNYRIAELAKIDVVTNVALSGLTIIAAIVGGIVGIAAVYTICSVVNSVWVAKAADAVVKRSRPLRSDVTGLVMTALPFGLASLMASMYFTIDLAILPYLVDAHQVGEYASAVKVVNMLVMVPNLVLAAALPGMAHLRDTPAGLAKLAGRVAHWLAAFALPACVLTIVFAPVALRVLFGSEYVGATTMLRVLAGAAVLTCLSELLGTLLSSQGVWRNQVLQNGVALTFNIAGNVILAPKYGGIASAWLTLATEVIVDAGSLWALSRRVDLRPCLSALMKPAAICLVFPAVLLVLGDQSLVAVALAVILYPLLLLAFRAWPVEFLPPAVARLSGT